MNAPRYVRNSSRIHLPTCRHAVNCVPWLWPEGRSDNVWLSKKWLIPCRLCLPELAAKQDALLGRSRFPSGSAAPPKPDSGSPVSVKETQ